MLQLNTEPKIHSHVGYLTDEKPTWKQFKWNVKTEIKQVGLRNNKMIVVPHFNHIY